MGKNDKSGKQRTIPGKSSSSRECKFKYPYSPKTSFPSLIRLSIYILMPHILTHGWQDVAEYIGDWLT
jgi:hypothetical protein